MSDDPRPDPDALLADIGADPSPAASGRLKIFLGMCPGVGKTYTMLLAGQAQQEEGVDVVIGVLETHGRVETVAVAAGLPRIPRRIVVHRGVTLEEMDLEAILARKPRLALVDELAHSNAAGSRHPKRWQDALELLQAGIDVYTTLNIQHIESYRDIVRQITGAPINETVADSVLDRADEIELIDITAEQLRRRLDEGKVYLGERAAAASANFFREGNLKALREIALRITADQADRDVREFMRSRRIAGPWRSRERLLVAVGSSPFSEQLIRLTRRTAAANHASWLAVHVDAGRPLDPTHQPRLESNLALARSLGAEVLLTSGPDVVETLLRVARENHVSQIVVGKPIVHPFVEWVSGGSLVSKLIRGSGEIDVYVVRAEKSAAPWRPDFAALRQPSFWRELGVGAAIVTGTTLLGLASIATIGYSAVGLLYLLSVLVGAIFLSQSPILLTAAVSALAWNFLFIPPTFTFHIRSAHDFILFAMYFVVALILGQLHSRLRQRERAERRREQQAVALYQFSRVLSTASPQLDGTLRAAVERLREIFDAEISILLADENGEASPDPAAGAAVAERERAVASWVIARGESAGRFTNTLPQSAGFHLPLRTSQAVVGVLVVFVPASAALRLAERQMLETFAAQLALVIEQSRQRRESERTRLEEKSRQLQKTLLDSVSHEFRTPLAVIAASADRLRAAHPDPLLDEIRTAVARLERVIRNTLDVTRIGTGAVRPQLVWCDLAEIVEAAAARVRVEIGGRSLVSDLTDHAIEVDPGLLEEILVNLLRNAAQHSPPGSSIHVIGRVSPGQLHLRVRDDGPGIAVEDREKVFDKFHRPAGSPAGGLGLGLSVVKGFAEALGGSITITERADARPGAEFLVILPIATRTAAELQTGA